MTLTAALEYCVFVMMSMTFVYPEYTAPMTIEKIASPSRTSRSVNPRCVTG